MTFLSTLSALDAAATPGPWFTDTDSDIPEIVANGRHGMIRPIAQAPHEGETEVANVELAALLRSAAPELAALVKAVQSILDEERRMFVVGTRHMFHYEFVALYAALSALDATVTP